MSAAVSTAAAVSAATPNSDAESARPRQPDASKTVSITVEFGGGMEVLFDYKRTHKLNLPIPVPTNDEDARSSPGPVADIRYLIGYLRKHLLTDQNRPELFVQGETVRPGILVLINDTDWELEGGLDYAIQPRDNIMFISTLHGG
ncbi:Ubiquitin- modifier 1 [Cystobasidiomycetes sp. EMM_F5]